MSDYIKLHRSMLEWEWYRNINTKVLFIHMLLKANWKEGKFEGKVIPRGSFVSSVPKLAEETDLTVREVRTGISHLKTTGEVTCKSYSKFTVFTVKNYDSYQVSDTQNDRQATDKRHSNDILTTTIEEKKEGKKVRNNNIFVPPSVDEVKSYCQERKNSVDAQSFVDFYTANGWVQGKGKPIKDWKACVRTWEKNNKKPNSNNTFTQFQQNDYDFDSIEQKLLAKK